MENEWRNYRNKNKKKIINATTTTIIAEVTAIATMHKTYFTIMEYNVITNNNIDCCLRIFACFENDLFIIFNLYSFFFVLLLWLSSHLLGCVRVCVCSLVLCSISLYLICADLSRQWLKCNVTQIIVFYCWFAMLNCVISFCVFFSLVFCCCCWYFGIFRSFTRNFI